MNEPETTRRASTLGSFLAVVLFGVLWMCAELVLTVISSRSVYTLEPLDRFVAFLPWQVALFALLGAVVSGMTRALSLRTTAIGWLATGLASLTFFGARLGEGILRRGAAQGGAFPRALLAVAAAAAGIAVLMWLLSRMGRFLSGGHRDRWPLAVWTGWSLFFLPFMHRVGPAIGGWGAGGPTAWMGRLSLVDALLAIVVTGAIVFAPPLPRNKLAAGGIAVATLVAALSLLFFAQARGLPAREAPDGMPNVFVILADTFRFDHLGLVDGSDSITPALDSLVQESIVFENTFSSSNNTPRSMPGVFTSLPSEMIGTNLPPDVITLPERLRDAGWVTSGISTNPFVSRRFGYEQGFDYFVDPNDVDEFLIASILRSIGGALPGPSYGLGVVDSSLFYRPAESVRRGAEQIVRDGTSPFFLYIHLMDPHGPYLPAKEWLTDDFRIEDFYSYFDFNYLNEKGVLNTEGFQPALKNIRQRYRSEIRGMDAALGRFIENLKESGSWDEALVIYLSDHGEAFGEHDWAGHGGHNVRNPVIRVPFLVKPPRSWELTARTESTPVSTISILPTIMALLGLPVDPNPFAKDLSGLIRQEELEDAELLDEERQAAELLDAGGVIVSRGENSYAVIDWPWKLIVRDVPEADSPRQLFDLSEDPQEQEDLLTHRPEIASRLEEKLGVWVENVSAGRRGSENIDIDADTLERLRSLGYIR